MDQKNSLLSSSLVGDELVNENISMLLGIEPTGNHVDAPAKFHVETFAAGKGNVDVIVINPKGQKEKVRDISRSFASAIRRFTFAVRHRTSSR